jgi:hypothetical protein
MSSGRRHQACLNQAAAKISGMLRHFVINLHHQIHFTVAWYGVLHSTQLNSTQLNSTQLNSSLSWTPPHIHSALPSHLLVLPLPLLVLLL